MLRSTVWMLLAACAMRCLAAELPAPPLDLPPVPQPEMTLKESRVRQAVESNVVPFDRKVGGGLRVDPVFTPREAVPRLQKPELWGEEIDGLIPLFGGEVNFKEVLASKRVELVKITPATADGDIAPLNYRETESKVLSDEDMKVTLALATADATYGWGELPECSPDYGFRLKFRSLDRVVMLDLCFTCRIARVAYAGKEVATTSFQPAHKEFVKLVEGYFKGALDRTAP